MAIETVDSPGFHKIRRKTESENKTSRQQQRRRVAADAVMNEEWSSQHAAPLFSIEISRDTFVEQLQERLYAAEEKLQHAFGGHVSRLKSIFKRG